MENSFCGEEWKQNLINYQGEIEVSWVKVNVFVKTPNEFKVTVCHQTGNFLQSWIKVDQSGQSTGRGVISNFLKKTWKNIGAEMEVLHYDRK